MILKRLLFYPLLIILLLIALLLTIVFVPGVPAIALKLGKGFIPEEVQIGSISGALAGGLKVNNIVYKQDDTLVMLESALLDWKPSCLLRSRLCVDLLHLDGLTLHLPESEPQPESESEPFQLPELPDVKLPFSLHLGSFQLSDVSVHQSEQVYRVERIFLSASIDQHISIESFRIEQGSTWLEWQAQLQPFDRYDLSSNLNWFIELADIEAIIGQTLETPVNSSIVGGLSISGDIDQLNATLENQLSTELTGNISSTIKAEVSPYTEELRIEKLLIQLTDVETDLSLSGKLTQWLDPLLDFSVTANNVAYPIIDDGEPKLVSIPRADLTLKGQLNQYIAELSASISGADIPETALNFKGEGSTESLTDFTLNAELLGGKVNIGGSLDWASEIAWNTQVLVENLNPGQFNPELEGNIQLELGTQGKLSDSGPNVDLNIVNLSGELRDQPLSGQGRVQYSTDEINIESLVIALGETQVDLQGQMQNEQLAIRFNLNAPNLSLLLPELSGQLSASGQLQGPMMTPAISATLSGENLAFDDNKVARLEGDIQVDLSGTNNSNLELSLSEVSAAGESLDSVEITLTGRPEQHRLELVTQGELIELSALINGRLNLETQAYNGSLSELSLERREVGRWQQQSSTAFSVNSPVFNLDELCLLQSQGSATLCLTASKNSSNRTSAEFSLSNLSLRLLDPYLDGVQIESNLNLSGQFSQQGSQHPSAQVLLTTTPGKLITPDDQPDFDLDPVRINANLSGDNLNAEIAAPFTEMDGQLSANLAIQQLSRQQLLSGDIALDINDLEMISVFVPNVQEIEGQLQGRFNISGSITQPVVRGFFDLKNAGADLPAQGIRLSPLQLSIRSEGDEGEVMSLQGLIGSGQGEIRLNGEFNLASFEGLLTIQGENFEAMATEINLLISPDMSIIVDEAIRVGGSITVPFAHITPPRQQAQNAIRASEDVVFVDVEEDGFTERNLPLLTDLELILGDSVVVEAFGFNGRLLGRIRIQDDGASATRASGTIQVESGDYRLFGQSMTIQRGSLVFSGGPIDNPGLDLRVSRTIDTVEAGARIVGTLLNPEFTLFSTPAMPDSSIMSYLILGRGPGESSASEQSMMLQAALALSMQGGNTITGQLREELNLDEFGFDTDDTGSSAFFIGKYLTPRLYIRYGVSLLESVEVLTLSYRLSSMWKVEAQSSSVGSGADFFFTRER